MAATHHEASLKLVTLKTVFLLTLASGRRRSEIHALQADFQRSEDWSKITLFPHANFVPKTAVAGRGMEVIQPLIMLSLSKTLSTDLQEDRSLCVVRALRFYLKATEDLRGRRTRLFIAFKKGHVGDIVMNTVSGWVKKTILLAYEGVQEDVARVHQVKMHDVRAVASSLAFVKQASLGAIMGACSWKSPGTFARFYLKELSGLRDGTWRLDPVVCAQTVCQ